MFIESEKITAVSLTALKERQKGRGGWGGGGGGEERCKFVDDRNYWTLHLNTKLSVLGLDTESQGYEKANISLAVTSQSPQ